MAGEERIRGFTIALGLNTVDIDKGMANLQRKLKVADTQMKANLSTFDKAEKSIDKLETELGGLNNKLEQQGRIVEKSKKKLAQLNEAEKESTKALKKAGLEADRANEKYEKLAKEFDDMNSKLEKHKKQLADAKQAQNRAKNQVDKLSASTKNAKATVNQLSKEFEELSKSGNASEKELSELRVELEKAENHYKQLSNELDKSKRKWNESKIATSEAKDELEKFSNANKEAMASSKTAMNSAKKNAQEAEKAYSQLENEVGKLPAKIDKATADVYQQALAFNTLESQIDDVNDEYSKLLRNQTLLGKMTVGIKAFDKRWQEVNAKINKIGDSFRNVGYVASGVVKGMIVQNISTIIPVAGAATSAVAGIGGAAVAASGGAIGMMGVYGTALGGISVFAGMAATQLARLEDGTLKVTGEVTKYQGALDALKNTWNGIADKNQANIFNTMTNGINIALLALQKLTPAIDSISGIISKASLKMFEWVKNSKNANQVFKVINSTGPPIFQNLVNAVIKVTDALAHMFIQFSPLFTWAGEGIESLATKFNKWANSASTDSSTAEFIRYTKTNLPIVGAIFGNIFGGIVGLFKAFGDHSHTVLIGMQNVTKTFKDWGQSLSSSDKFKSFIDYLNTNGPIVWQLLKNIGSTLVGLVRGMAPVGAVMLKITTAITGFISKIVNSSPAVGAFIGILAALVGGLMTLIPPIALARTAFGGLGGAAVANGKKVGFMSKALGVLRGAFKLLLGPWGILIAALVTGFVIAYKKSETFRNIVNAALNGVKNTFITIGNVVKGFFQLFQGNGQDGVIMLSKILPPNVVVGLTNFANTVKNTFFIVFNAIKGFAIQIGSQIGAFWAKNGTEITQAVKNVATIISTTFSFIWNNVIKPIMTLIWNLMKFIWPGIKALVVSVWNNIKGVIQGALNIILGTIKIFSSILTGNWKGAWNGLVQVLKGVVQLIWNLVQLWFVGKIVKVAKLGMSLLKGVFTKGWKFIHTFIATTAYAIWNSVKQKFSGLNKSIKAIVTSIKKWLSTTWTSIKKSVVNQAQSLWSGVKSRFSSLWKSTKSIFTTLKNWTQKTWINLKKYVVNTAQNLYKSVRDKFSNLWKSTKSIFTTLKNWTQKTWNSLRTKVVSLAKSLGVQVKNIFSKLWSNVKNIFTKTFNFAKSIWGRIQNTVVKLANGAKNGVVNGFKAMHDKGKSWINKLKNFLKDSISGFKSIAKKVGNGVANGAISGLNAMIDGINSLSNKIMSKKLIKKKIPKLSTGTGIQTDSNGLLKRGTKAIVNDKGPGNGIGPNGHQELIYRRDGKIEKPLGRNKQVHLKRGEGVINGAQSKSLLPHLSTGTISKDMLKKARKHKKHDEVHGDVPEKKGGGGNALTAIADSGNKAWNWTTEQAKKAKDTFGKAIGDVWDYANNPMKLVNKMLKHFGVDFSDIGGAMGGTIKWAYKGLKKGVETLLTGWFDDGGGDGDSSFIDLSKGINFPFSPNGKAPGYPFNSPHYGIDLNYVYDKLFSVFSGKATARNGYNGGFGKMVDIVSGATKVIYGHMSKHAFSGSKQVKPGDYLGISGNTGRSSGPHLHFEVQKNGVPIDPLNWLKKNNGKSAGGSKAASKWRGDILRAASSMKVNLSPGNIKDIISLIHTESGGRAGVTQSGYIDVNTGGNEARGLLQYTPGTWNAYKAKGAGNILNGFHQLKTFFNNTNWRRDLSAWKARMARGQTGWGPTGSRRFATGGLIGSNGLYNLADGGFPEWVIPTDPKRRTDAMKLLALAGQDIQKGKNKRPKQLPNPKNVSGSSDDTSLLLKMIEGQQQQIALLVEMVKSNQVIADKDFRPSIDKYAHKEEVFSAIDEYNRQKSRKARFSPA
ncbi:peptidoglycan DD-metalloendopeptidase family protein [Mammaliicoccus sciuri]|uniref:peptidoglycan DD-metalloendopeptidase family protein n=1 Tax=Mammaliicoccus sciuri TaxID=1296 RepID=UPI00397C94C5